MEIDDKQNGKWYNLKLGKECYLCSHLLSCMNQQCPARRVLRNKMACED